MPVRAAHQLSLSSGFRLFLLLLLLGGKLCLVIDLFFLLSFCHRQFTFPKAVGLYVGTIIPLAIIRDTRSKQRIFRNCLFE